MKRTLTFYFSSKDVVADTLLCDVRDLCYRKDLFIFDLCIDNDMDLLTRFSAKTPTILVGPYQLNWPFKLHEVEVAIDAIVDFDREFLDSPDERLNTKIPKFTKKDSFGLWFSKSYVWVISLFLTIFVLISFFAPILERSGNNRFASGIYNFYSLLCHQLAYRSFFLGGSQYFYPRELSASQVPNTYEEITGKPANDLEFARTFVGNEEIGYKVALCERDVAIYGSLAFTGLLFQFIGKRIKPLKWYLWILIALIPIGLDGFSQLPSLSVGLPAWLPLRESTPFLRILTGALFGGGTGWYIFPLMEETMKETRFQLSRKRAIINNFKHSAG